MRLVDAFERSGVLVMITLISLVCPPQWNKSLTALKWVKINGGVPTFLILLNGSGKFVDYDGSPAVEGASFSPRRIQVGFFTTQLVKNLHEVEELECLGRDFCVEVIGSSRDQIIPPLLPQVSSWMKKVDAESFVKLLDDFLFAGVPAPDHCQVSLVS
jgi:hypothetical protein